MTTTEEESPQVLEEAQNPLDLEPMNENKKKILQELQYQIDLQNTILRTKALEDLFIFNRYILEVEKGKQEFAPFHKKLCRTVTDNVHKKKLLLVPRGHLKSTLVTIGYCVQQIIKNPNIRILIVNATWQMAVDFLTEIKRHLTTNEKILELWGNVAENPDEWSQDRIMLKRTDPNIKGPTVWAAGVESNLVGSHPDLIIFDDVVNRDNSNTPESIEKVILRYKDATDLLEPKGQFIIIGTRWNEADLYGWILDRENNIRESFDVFLEKAYQGDITTGEAFVPLWPEKFSREELQTRLREEGWFHFSSQYMNDPVPAEDATFKRSDFQYYDPLDIRGKEMNKVLTIDPAISVSKDADFTAMIGTGIDLFTNIFILEIIRAHLTPSQIIDKIFQLNEIFHFNQIGIETIAYQKALAYALKEEMQKRRRYLPIVEIQSHDTSKDQRIKGLQPSYQAHKVFHPKNHPNLAYFENELLMFPRGRKDDMIDAFSMQLPLLYPPKQKKSRYHAEYLY